MKYLDVRAARHVYGDGIHDDTKALQDALDKMKSGGTVYFPDGVYLISAALIFYSNQWLKFSDRAVLRRSDKSENITRYMLAAYSEPNVGGYEGTHDVVISGGVFDGNENLTENLTVINTVHCNNIVIKNCSFVHGANWHYIELNSTADASVRDCVFDGRSYTAVRENLTSELVQLDAADENCYGPVYDWRGALIDFKLDRTPCRNVSIASCIFKCAGSTAIGHHGDHAHENIDIIYNVFDGVSGIGDFSRGYIYFMPQVKNVNISDNAFFSSAEEDAPNITFAVNNLDPDALKTEGNAYYGAFSD